MAEQKTPKKPGKSNAAREDRLKAALKANLGRRKTQAKARADDAVQNDKSKG
ncbi:MULTISPECIES: hypothetical protein [Roseobacteraceae]|uniref:DUF4169 domain-containing protein n=1 Tax=Falsiruegeria litorea TaxID=1280831 RepID=A0ABS5WXE4_9RHOB|nr:MULTISPECIES: hypothetical protein [Roseobacteraceae]MBT3143309.1 hypothetical protein [Falsiruegeria litorea]MBT8167573.1 hypothetical protein [Falsiruegeria litorea]